MISIGIIGFGNISLNVHLPVLLSRNDIKIVWIVDKDIKLHSLFKKKKSIFITTFMMPLILIFLRLL